LSIILGCSRLFLCCSVYCFVCCCVLYCCHRVSINISYHICEDRSSIDWTSVRVAAWFRVLDRVWNVMAHAQKPDFVFSVERTSPFKSAGGGRQFSRLLAAEVCASAVVMLYTPCSEVVWRVLATHCIREFPLHFPYRASPCAITFQLESTPHPPIDSF